MTFYDERGRRLDLSPQGKSGGEGTVHRITNDTSRVAKIYHSARLNDGLHTKLRAMLEHPPDDPSWSESRHRSIAWADGLVFADSSGRDFRGFTMPYVDMTEFRQAHVYYDASDRLREFGGAFTWRHLVFAAHNLASAVGAVHAAGHRVGDLRETNLLVAPSALATLIDCDSFQIRDPRTQQVHPTRVATGDYLPPELQGVDFRNATPDRYHADLFALAVLIFRFLMLGVHPFQSRGAAVADAPSTEAKISKGLFAFAGRKRGVEPPEYAPPFAVMPKAVQELAVRAFVNGHRQPDARPQASEWASVLETEGRRLRKCAANSNHWYSQGSRSCSWCRISPDPFPGAVGRQIAIEGAASQIPEAARVEQLRAYARVALADGAITDAELVHLRKAGGELGLRRAVIDRIVDDESRRAGPRIAPPQQVQAPPAPATTRPSTRVWSSISHPVRLMHAVRSRRARSIWKAALPALLACALAGALAPVVAPAAAALAGLPSLALVGESRPGSWRAWMRLPLRFLVHLHQALGHTARVFVPLAVVGAVLSFTPVAHTDLIARGLAAAALAALGWLAIVRLPHSSDASAPAIRRGRDLVWGTLVGDSGRLRRPGYALWIACVSATAAVGANVALTWPLQLS